MDNTIRIITDSGCDISKENEEKYKGLLEIMPFMVTIQGKSYVDRQDIQAEEFYKVLKEQQEIPKHSQITAIQFEDKYRESTNTIFNPDPSPLGGLSGVLHAERNAENLRVKEVMAEGYRLELEKIQEYRENGQLTRKAARDLREEVYLLQMDASDALE